MNMLNMLISLANMALHHCMSQNEEEDQETDTCSKEILLLRTFVDLKALIDAVCTVKLGQTALSKRARTTTNITYFQTAAGGSLKTIMFCF